MELLEKLELVDVEISDGKAVVTFIDRERGEIREVNFNKKRYDQDKKSFVDDEETAEKTEARVQRLFGLEFDKLGQAIGEKHDIYAYDNFNSMEEVKVVNKFTLDEVGEMIQTEIDEIKVDNVGIHILFTYNDKTYQVNMNYSTFVPSTREWFKNPQKEKKQLERFKQKFHVGIEEKDSLIGQNIMVEVRQMPGTENTFGDVKKIPKPKA